MVLIVKHRSIFTVPTLMWCMYIFIQHVRKFIFSYKLHYYSLLCDSLSFASFEHKQQAHAHTCNHPPAFCCVQWKVLQTGGPHTHVGETFTRLGLGLAAPHGDAHLDALCGQRQERPLRLCVEGRQRLAERSSQRVSGTWWRGGMSQTLCKLDYRFTEQRSRVCKRGTEREDSYLVWCDAKVFS